MGRKVYISFKTEDLAYKTTIQAMENLDYVDKSLNEPINSDDEDYILRRIRADYLYDSTVTIFLIGDYSAEDLGAYEQRFIKRELQASLYRSESHAKNGILGVVLPAMRDKIFGGNYLCAQRNSNHNLVSVNDSTVVSEFSYNYYIPNGKCFHSEDERYAVLVRWEDFEANPGEYIERAFETRTAVIAMKTRVRP